MTLHDDASKPTPLIALICLAIVRRYRPGWTTVSVTEAAAAKDQRAERISRLASRALAALHRAVAAFTRLGRPPADRAAQADAIERPVLGALLALATSLLRHVRLCGPAVRAIVVGAFVRLRAEHPSLTQKRFCEALALSERTFRDWTKRERSTGPGPVVTPQPKPTPAPPPRQPRLRRPRFRLNLVVPGTQLLTDTTGLSACGVPLKLIAAQDIGGRDDQLLESVIVDETENADLVVRVLTEAIDGREGMQALCDQGTPYMAQKTRDALDSLGADHVPQREADPLSKSPIEKATGTVKRIARPLLDPIDLPTSFPSFGGPTSP